jgi:2-keto-4-pentenoate hydratase/2-oxohepta-3-ene-1,7-dioic acid hydratase in catechol pathway
MKFCRFLGSEGARFGLVESRDGHDVITAELGSPQMQVSAAGVPEQIVLPELIQGKPVSGKILAEPFPIERAKLLIPFPIISKILCVGRNYAAHVRELEHEMPSEPVIFSKPPSALLAPGGQIVRPSLSKRVDHEGELGIFIGRRCHKMRADESARDYILGYTVVNDVTARDLQKTDGQWTRS